MGVLSVLIVIPLMMFVWLVVELIRNYSKMKKLRIEKALAERKYESIKNRILELADESDSETAGAINDLIDELSTH